MAEPTALPGWTGGESVAAMASAARKILTRGFLIYLHLKAFEAPGAIMKVETISMARGWESKSVESQIESAESRPLRAIGVAPTAAQVNLMREKENLTLSRTRVLRDLETSKNPRYVQLLNRELKTLDERLSKLN